MPELSLSAETHTRLQPKRMQGPSAAALSSGKKIAHFELNQLFSQPNLVTLMPYIQTLSSVSLIQQCFGAAQKSIGHQGLLTGGGTSGPASLQAVDEVKAHFTRLSSSFYRQTSWLVLCEWWQIWEYIRLGLCFFFFFLICQHSIG